MEVHLFSTPFQHLRAKHVYPMRLVASAGCGGIHAPHDTPPCDRSRPKISSIGLGYLHGQPLSPRKSTAPGEYSNKATGKICPTSEIESLVDVVEENGVV